LEYLVYSNDDVWEDVGHLFERSDASWERVDAEDELLHRLDGRFEGAVIIEMSVVNRDPDQLVSALRTRQPRTPIFVLVHQPFVDRAVDLMRAGATDVRTLPLDEREYQEILQTPPVATDLADPSQLDTDFIIEEARGAIEADQDERAHELLRQALAADAENGPVFNLLGVLAEKGGDPDVAQKFYRAAQDLEPTYEPARENLERTTIHGDQSDPTLGPSISEADDERDDESEQ
jgi:tetratricopeptide (TPR) repeat protein